MKISEEDLPIVLKKEKKMRIILPCILTVVVLCALGFSHPPDPCEATGSVTDPAWLWHGTPMGEWKCSVGISAEVEHCEHHTGIFRLGIDTLVWVSLPGWILLPGVVTFWDEWQSMDANPDFDSYTLFVVDPVMGARGKVQWKCYELDETLCGEDSVNGEWSSKPAHP